MNKAKLRKSMIKPNQNSRQVSQHLQYFPLLIVKRQSLQLSQRGLEVIQDQASGKVFLIALYSKNSRLINAIYRNNSILSNEDQQQSGVWITNYPRYRDEKDVKFIYLQVKCKDSQSAILLHTFCSLICSAVIVDLDEIHTFDFITSVENRIIYDHQEQDSNIIRKHRRKQLASLLFLKKSKGKQANNQIRKNSKELDQILDNQKTIQILSSLYQEMGLLKHSSDMIQSMPNGELNQVEMQIYKVCLQNQKNEELFRGPILKQYIQIIVNTLRFSNKVEIKECFSSIKISEGYNAYLQALSYYELHIRKELQQQGCPDLKQKLRLTRQDTILQYKKQTNDAIFLIKLQEYLDQTEEKLIAQNNKIYDLINLAYLKQFSNDLISKVQAGRLTIPQAQANLQKMTEHYKSTAAGDNKFQILTNGLNLLHKAINNSVPKEDNSKLLKELQLSHAQNTKLLKKVDELEEFRRRQSSSKCCEIM